MQTETVSAADALLATHALNRHAKTLPPVTRAGIYGLKERLCRALCERGYCTGAELEVPANTLADWQFALTFDVDNTVIALHMPRSRVTWEVVECEPLRYAPCRPDVQLTPRECGALMALVARWLNEQERAL